MRIVTKAKNAFVPLAVLIAVVVVILIGGVAIIAWRTTYLDSILPSEVKEFFGRGGTTPPESYAGIPFEITQPKDPTKDWRTYTNTDFKFSFKYPANWEISPLSSKEFLIFEPQEGNVVDGQKRPSLEVFPVGGYGSDYGYDAVMGPGMEPQWEISEEVYAVGGRPTKRTEHTYIPTGAVELVLVFFGDPTSTEMRLAFYPLNGELELLDLILGTFEFL